MKTIIALVCLLFTIVATQDAVKTIVEAHALCYSNPDTYISDEDSTKLAHGEPLSRSVYGPFATCISNYLHTQRPNGEADIDTVRKYLANILEDEANAQKFLEQCNVQKSERAKTARAIYICLHDALRDAGKHP